MHKTKRFSGKTDPKNPVLYVNTLKEVNNWHYADTPNAASLLYIVPFEQPRNS
jgi:hypothetical protein